MDLEKLPLAERVRRCQSGATAYPEYIPSIIRRLGEMPVMEYLSGIDKRQKQRFSELVGLCYEDSTFQWAALRIAELNGKRPELAAEAMRILAGPMIQYDEAFRREEERTHARF